MFWFYFSPDNVPYDQKTNLFAFGQEVKEHGMTVHSGYTYPELFRNILC